MATASDNGRHVTLGLGVRSFASASEIEAALEPVLETPVKETTAMSNANYNNGRGERTQTKATTTSEHKFGGSHAANTGGSKRGDAPVKGSHGKGGMKSGRGC